MITDSEIFKMTEQKNEKELNLSLGVVLYDYLINELLQGKLKILDNSIYFSEKGEAKLNKSKSLRLETGIYSDRSQLFLGETPLCFNNNLNSNIHLKLSGMEITGLGLSEIKSEIKNKVKDLLKEVETAQSELGDYLGILDTVV